MTGILPITRPGIYAMPAEAYHGCTEPFALSSTGARTLMAECPYLFWWESPLNPAFQPKRKREFDIGTAAHLLVLEPEKFDDHVVNIEQPDFRTKEARTARDIAYDAGRTPLLQKDVDLVRGMRDAVMRHPVASLAFENALPEQSIFWIDEEFGVWRKTRPDALPKLNNNYIVDLKTATTANPEAFAKSCWSLGYYQRAAYYLDAVEAVTGNRVERFCWIVVDKNPPHMVSVCWADFEMLKWGRIQNRKAVEIFARCLAANEWPGYVPKDGRSSHTIRLPYFATMDLQEREANGDFEIQSFHQQAAE